MTEDNPDFWQLMIPGVGRAPVTAFRVLITVFVVAIGPVNYFFLKRKGNLHLLLAVVPITALLVTGGLFAYALLTDGLQVRVRPRSFTAIDQQRQHAASWARMTYYAGLSPASGLQFDADTAVLPIDPHSGNDYSPIRRKMGWEGDRQRYSSGWLYSRTPTQFLSIRSRPTTAGLRVKPAADGGAPSVTNALGAKLLHLYLRDEQGRLYLSKEAERGAVCKLVEAGDEPDIADLRMLLSSRAPALMQDMQLTDVAYYSGSFRSYPYYGPNTFTPSQREGLLEESYRMVDDWLRLPATFPPRNYIAVVEESPEVDFGLEAPQQVLPMHVIHGQW